MLTMKARQHFKLRLTAYGSPNKELVFDTKAIVAAPDSTVTDTLRYATYKLAVDIQAFPSCYDEEETAYDVTISGAEYVGVGSKPLSMEVLGSDADVEVFCLSGQMYANSLNPALCDGEKTHNINSPAAAPSVICVGATAHRTCVTNFKGEKIDTGINDVGDIAYYSSVGPTFAGLTKPDVVAPGSAITSAFSSFYIEDILIKPTWEELKEEDRDKFLIEIDPGVSFGTGKHESTQLVIRQLQKYLKASDEVLDVGCGSGILSIVAAKLGAQHIVGTDIDADCIASSYENFDVNHLERSLADFYVGNLIDDSTLQENVGYEKYDVVVANILADIIIPMAPALAKTMKPGAIVITSGIIDFKEQEVADALKAAGLTIIESNAQGEWRNITARK